MTPERFCELSRLQADCRHGPERELWEALVAEREEVERLEGWLRLIDGADTPCMDGMSRLTTLQMEICIAEYFGVRRNIIVPNVSWGVGLHECDLLIVRPSGHAVEVEIKVSLADLKKDAEKWHGHVDLKRRIGRLYFAIPLKLQDKAIGYIPEHAGVITVDEDRRPWARRVAISREARWDREARFTDDEINKIARLGAMRIWSLKRKIVKIKTAANE